MGPKRRKSRIYWRGERAWADFRDYADVGGKREPLVADGQTLATTSPRIAERLMGKRLKDLEERRWNRVYLGITKPATLADFIDHHMDEKEKSQKGFTAKWLKDTRRRLDVAAERLGAERELASIRVADVQAFVNYLSATKSRKGGKLASGTIRHYMNALSNLYKRAASEGRVPKGYNPVADLLDKPQMGRSEADWLEVHEAALFLEAARIMEAERDAYFAEREAWFASGKKGSRPIRPIAGRLEIPLYPLVATYLLTGGRFREITGLTIADVSLDRRTVTFRPNAYRRIKSESSQRVVPMWPQLYEVLREHLAREGRIAGLLFRSIRTDGMVRDVRVAFDTIARRAGIEAGRVRPHLLRHTYTAARLQTTDQGAPVSTYTVSKELGHESPALVERIYGHLGEVRHRAEVVEFRVEQHVERLAGRLEVLRA